MCIVINLDQFLMYFIANGFHHLEFVKRRQFHNFQYLDKFNAGIVLISHKSIEQLEKVL